MDLIVGAGVTGLSYALYTPVDYQVIERELEPGGYCRTVRQDGFIWDYAGHFFHFRDQDIKKEILSGIPENHILEVEKQSQIRYKGQMVDYPFQTNIHQLPRSEYIDCLYDSLVNPYEEERTFKQMLYRRFGKSVSEKFLIPYNEKVYSCDLNNLDVNAMGRFLPCQEKSYNARFFYATGGAREYVDSLLNRLDPDRVSYGEKLESIDMDNRIAVTDRREICFDRLISTIPFPQLLDTCGIEYDRSLYTCNKVLVFNIGFDKKGLDVRNHWVYYPESDYIFYRVGCYDNIADTDRLSVYVEIGYRENEKVDVDKAYQRVLQDLKKAGIISDHQVVSTHSVLLDPAYVHNTKAMESDREEKKQQLAGHGIYSIGRYGSWTYESMEDGVLEARQLAARLN